MAKLYETVVIVDAMIPEDAIESEFDAIESRISAKGSLLKSDKWGKRKLAYEIKGRSHGEYAVFYYEAPSSFPVELERGFRINENILRWLTVADNPAGIPETISSKDLDGEDSKGAGLRSEELVSEDPLEDGKSEDIKEGQE